MLEAIVKEKNVHRMLRFEALTLGKTILPNAKGNAPLKPKFHQLNFVASALFAAIATAKNRHALPVRKEFLCQPDDHWSLARTADCQITNADHRRLQPFLLEPAGLVQPNAHTHTPAIRHAKWPEQILHEFRQFHRAALQRNARAPDAAPV